MKGNTAVLLFTTVASIFIYQSGVNATALRQRVLSKASEQANACLIGGYCPQGDYLNYCYGCSTNSNGVLTCQYCNGVYAQNSGLQNAWACENNIYVYNNVPTCRFPAGSYFLSDLPNQGQCTNCYMGSYASQNSLTCLCQRWVGDTSPVLATLSDVSNCAWIANVNGVLTCTVGTNVPSTPSPTVVTPAPTYPTPQPTYPTPSPTGVCTFTENTPQSPCYTKTQGNGCAQYNYCCYNPNGNPVCSPPPNCPECPTLSLTSCSNYPSCCTISGGQCTRNCAAQANCPIPFIPGS